MPSRAVLPRPFFWIALDEEGGHLKANLPRTWKRNFDGYRKNKAEIDALIRDILWPSCQAKSSFITIPTG
jgi:hypothetical protein